MKYWSTEYIEYMIMNQFNTSLHIFKYIQYIKIKTPILPYDFPRFKFPFLASPISSFRSEKPSPTQRGDLRLATGSYFTQEVQGGGVPTSLLMSSARIPSGND